MSATIFDGKALATDILENVSETIQKKKLSPLLAIVLVGDNEGSLAYIRQKRRAAATGSITISLYHFVSDIPGPQLVLAINDIQHGITGEWQRYLINRENVHNIARPQAIIVQRPLPAHINYDAILEAIDPERDVDGFHPKSPFSAPVAQAVMETLYRILRPWEKQDNLPQLLNEHNIALVGYGQTAGKPISRLLAQLGIHHEIIAHNTPNPQAITRQADIVIVAVGKPYLITKNWLQPLAIVIDVGISRIENDGDKIHLAGDVALDAQEIASVITPVPGGIGPVNVACLMKNVLLASES